MSPSEGFTMSAKRNVLPSVLVTTVLTAAALLSVILGDQERGKTITTVNRSSVSAAATPKRIRAYEYVKRQMGEPYCYGGNGPSCWDCSGVVKKAYDSVGIYLPRTTGDMLRDSRDQLVQTNYPRNGDLVLNSGHVELYVHQKNGVRWMLGAHRSGTVISYRKIYSGLKFYRVRGAG